ncbi:uncharacterized protein MELLADRAFT_107436 [Melampsora larici-populina 98AG31]|uniref:Uncharacterized protein n=1 Tax=Melampsora larici-populina (strain 98AG31 / pathotype 3-4-7) TaxID=747676 RepID=F4RPT0_MELLP|nr:uncharacterized protein MELLADRAFT_107436 [Melampsora larici-populina 98AG31]EGG05685.1 hypothetical protein MELLADRAFT_107436 [Melampsora larici-populina 98AG31]
MASRKSSPYHLPCDGCISKVSTHKRRVVQQPKTNQNSTLRLSEMSERPPKNVKGTGCLTLTYEAGSYYLQKIPTVMLWRSAFRSILTHLNIMAIVAIWLAGQYPTGCFSESLKHWTPEFLPSAWGNIIQSPIICCIFET